MTLRDRLYGIKKLALEEKISETEVLEDWETVLKEMSRCGFDVSAVYYDLQTLKADHDRSSRQRLHHQEH